MVAIWIVGGVGVLSIDMKNRKTKRKRKRKKKDYTQISVGQTKGGKKKDFVFLHLKQMVESLWAKMRQRFFTVETPRTQLLSWLVCSYFVCQKTSTTPDLEDRRGRPAQTFCTTVELLFPTAQLFFASTNASSSISLDSLDRSGDRCTMVSMWIYTRASTQTMLRSVIRATRTIGRSPIVPTARTLSTSPNAMSNSNSNSSDSNSNSNQENKARDEAIHRRTYLLEALGASAAVMAIAYATYDPIAYGAQSYNWPTVTGTIDEARVVTQKNTYIPAIIFSYELNGRKYRSSVVSFRFWTRTPEIEEARRLMQLYREGQPVTVRYNPKNPAVGILEPAISPEALFYLGCSSSLLFFTYIRKPVPALAAAGAAIAASYYAKQRAWDVLHQQYPTTSSNDVKQQ
jgi:hypothetical protein